MDRSVGRSPGVAPAPSRRGLAIVAAVVIAVVGVTACSDDGANTSSTSGPSAVTTPESLAVDPSGSPTVVTDATSTSVEDTTTTTVVDTTTTEAPTTTTTIPLVTTGAIVLVANAADVPGAAGRLTTTLQILGFTTKSATDAAGYEETVDVSKIYFKPEAEAAAMSLGAIMGISSVTRMPTPPPIVGALDGLGDATLLLMLGKDLADKDIPGFAGR